VFHISIWGLGALFEGKSPPKAPRGDRTGAKLSYISPHQSVLHKSFFKARLTRYTQEKHCKYQSVDVFQTFVHWHYHWNTSSTMYANFTFENIYLENNVLKISPIVSGNRQLLRVVDERWCKWSSKQNECSFKAV